MRRWLLPCLTAALLLALAASSFAQRGWNRGPIDVPIDKAPPYDGRFDTRALHDYIAKGGFVIFDDFRGGYDWENFRASMQRVLPGEVPMELALTHPIFHSFFEITTLEFHQAYDRGEPRFYGYFEKNDPNKPLQMIVNFNNDVSEYWEFSDTGFAPIDLSNEAYKLGVNYVVYAMTH